MEKTISKDEYMRIDHSDGEWFIEQYRLEDGQYKLRIFKGKVKKGDFRQEKKISYGEMSKVLVNYVDSLC